MLAEYNFPSIIEDSFNAGFYPDAIQLAEIYLALITANHQNTADNEVNSKVLYHLASSYHLTGQTEHAIFLLENEKKLNELNSFLLAKYYFVLKKYEKFILFSISKISYRPENDHGNLITQRFGRYSGFVMQLLSQHLYSINKASQAESMLNFSLEKTPFLISSLNQSIQQNVNRSLYDHFKKYIKTNRKRTSSDIDVKPPMTLACVQHNNTHSDSPTFVPSELHLSHHSDKLVYNENNNSIRVTLKTDPERNIHLPKQIIGTLAASTPMNVVVGGINVVGSNSNIIKSQNNNILLHSPKNYEYSGVGTSVRSVTSTTPFTTNVLTTLGQTTFTENTNQSSSSTTHYKTPQTRYNHQDYDGLGYKDPIVKPRVVQRPKMVHFEEDIKESKTPKNIPFNISCLSETIHSYTSESLSLPLPDINVNGPNLDHENYSVNPLQSNLEQNADNYYPENSNNNNGSELPVTCLSANSHPEIQPNFSSPSSSSSSRVKRPLPDSILRVKSPSSLSYTFVDVLYKATKIYYYMFRYDCDEVIRLYDLLPPPIRTLPIFMSTLAVAQFHKHNYDACINIFRRLQFDYPYYCNSFEYFSTALWHKKKFALLEKIAAFLKRHMPMSSQTWITCGNYYSLAKRHDIAVHCFKRSLQLDAKNAYACALIGKEYLELENVKEAFYYYKRGLLINRYCYQLWYLTSEAHMHRQQFSLAEQCINTAIRINSHDPVVWSLAAAVDYANNHFVPAINKIDRALELDALNESFHIFKVTVLMRLKKWAESKDILLAILENDRHSDNATQIYLQLGKIYLYMNDFQSAETYLTKCIDLDLGGTYCAEARKVMGKIGLLQGGLSSQKNSLLDIQSDDYVTNEFKPVHILMNLIMKREN